MEKYYPSISIVIPVFNSELCLGLCLESIRNQDYPREKLEIIIVDAGSTDKTLDIARQYEADMILANPLKTGEAGKSVGVSKAKNEIIALIDSDNILEGNDWLTRMAQPFADPEIAGSEPWLYTYRPGDPLITRYCALLGMNDPLCFYLGNYDRISQINGKWTSINVPCEDRGDYLKADFYGLDYYPTIGANGFMIRRELVLKAHYEPYLFDIDIPAELLPMGYHCYAKVKLGIIHLYAKNLSDFTRKQKRRVRDFLFYRGDRKRYYPWDKISRWKLVKFVLSTVLIFPIVIDIIRGYLRKPDRAWWFHLAACWTTLIVYGTGRILALFPSRNTILNRDNWNK
jgi:glycosyltransferase involved in cell wall biosynthesis